MALRKFPKTSDALKRLCHEAFFAGRNNGGDSSPADPDFDEILVSSELAFEHWWAAAWRIPRRARTTKEKP